MARKRTEKTVADLMRLNPQFRRSVQIELDFNDPDSICQYVATDFLKSCFQRIKPAFNPNSSQRAWRITGDYGSGKSAFALALAKMVSGKRTEVPVSIRGLVKGDLFPILVTGERESLPQTIGKAIVKQFPRFGRKPIPSNDSDLLDLVKEAHKKSPGGLFIVLDELGKNLENAVMNPASSDVYILQKLAEIASRSGEKPLIVVGILHMGISSYTNGLDSNSRKEWDKVSGRYDEILFHHPFEQTVQLCAAALAIDTKKLPRKALKTAKAAMKWATDAGLYLNADTNSLCNFSSNIFPIHPITFPPLMMLLRRFGQNERSLFSFLSGYEKNSLQEVSSNKITDARSYDLPDLYDYFDANLSHGVNNGKAAHWKVIRSVVNRNENPAETAVLKAVGILNLIDDDSILATKELLHQHFVGSPWVRNQTVESIIQSLLSSHQLFERGSVRGFALWPHSSVHLDDAFNSAKSELGEPKNPIEMVSSFLPGKRIVARRHYIETGNLRHFDLSFESASSFDSIEKSEKTLNEENRDGRIVIFLPKDEREYQSLLLKLKNGENSFNETALIGISKAPIELFAIANDLRIWLYVAKTVNELASDAYARSELQNQIETTRNRLAEKVDDLLSLHKASTNIFWFRKKQQVSLGEGGIVRELSEICDEVYRDCPIVRNELVNRRVTSSAASRARSLLIDGIVENPAAPFLGMNEKKNPPEMSIYLSVLREGNIHVETPDGFRFTFPKKGKRGDPCRLLPSFMAVDSLLRKSNHQRVNATELYDVLRSKPIGARDGLIPLIISVYLAVRSNQVAVYEDSTYLHGLGSAEIQRLAKEPEFFEFQFCSIEGVRLETFEQIKKILGIPKSNKPDVLDIVRPVMKFIANVPEYSRNTNRLSKETILFRRALLSARDPVNLLFKDIPAALDVTDADPKTIGKSIASAVSEIQNSYDALLTRISKAITDAFDTNSAIDEFRKELGLRCAALTKGISEAELKSFILRLGDSNLKTSNWLESIGNHVARKSPTRWGDDDEDVFHVRFFELSKRMLRAESAQADIGRLGLNGNSHRVFRLALTRPSGEECTELLHYGQADEARVKELESAIAELIQKNGRAGLNAAAAALWKQIEIK